MSSIEPNITSDVSSMEDALTKTTWNISIKRVNESEQSSFTLTVSPEDDVAYLQKQIQGVTGLEPSQQRLIYRGRIISAILPNNNLDLSADESNTENDRGAGISPTTALQLKDINGLADGHTIHLIKRKEQVSANESPQTDSNQTPVDADLEASTEGLLAAILGMGESTTEDDSPPSESPTLAHRLRTPRIRASRRRFHHRLEAEDLELPDPGSMESVRQGLMTMHTLLPAAEAATPLNVNRRWYLGQWIDCLDTVNQWLEATIIDIVDPDSILPPRQDHGSETTSPRTQFISSETRNNDSFVAAADLERRTQLLLEPCENDDPDDEGGEHAGWKRRDNRGVKLLLVHYNGWPHRWDEWLRSDSDRIRPFRTRTRHPNSSPYSCPTPQSSYSESPSTHIRSDVEVEDRHALLPELSRVMNEVNELMNRINSRTSSECDDVASISLANDLPWTVPHDEEKEEDSVVAGKLEVNDSETGGHDRPNDANLNPRDLEVLAPLMDRLGRILIDAAPHITSLARHLRDNQVSGNPEQDSVASHTTSLGNLFSLLTRDRPVAVNNAASAESDNTSAAVVSNAVGVGEVNEEPIDPDHTDFSAGVVNTSRGEIRSGPRNRSHSNGDDATNLFGAYLASASLGGMGSGDGDNGLQGLGRVLGDRTGGIDIHIHAVVTAPGVPPGILGLAGLVNNGSGTGGGGGGTIGSTGNTATVTPETAGGTFLSRSRSSSQSSNARRRMSAIFQEENDDDMGIFSELYSENPASVDPVAPALSNSPNTALDVPEEPDLEHPSPLPPHRIPSRRLRQNTNSSSSSGMARSNSASERGHHGRFLNRFFRRSNSET